jgi:ribose-phosphate pyrophosphokinase
MNSKMTELIFTDSIPFDQTKCPKVRVISVADMFAETIMQVYNHESISAKYLL